MSLTVETLKAAKVAGPGPIRLLPEHVAGDIAQTILQGFNKHFSIFREITRQAHGFFIEGNWMAARQAAIDRISLYGTRIGETVDELSRRYRFEAFDSELWQSVKLHYVTLLYQHQQPELAETYYNSVFVRLFDRHYYKNENIFVRPCVSTERLDSDDPVYRSFYPTRDGWRDCLSRILKEADHGLPYADLIRDIRRIVSDIRNAPRIPGVLPKHFQLQILRPLLYRNKSAYIVGRAIIGPEKRPLIIRLRRSDNGQAYVDRLITSTRDIANIFSSARAYFLVDTRFPSALVKFLLTLLPEKMAADLYTQIGFHKQGKAEFYRDFLDHIQRSSDQLETAPGSRGLVMLVFTLPSYPYVFKVIRDRFKPPKDTTRKAVIDKYHMVKMRDRVGRMSDAWEFSYTAFPLGRFTDELLDELKTEAAAQLIIENDTLIIKHLFIERRLEPLNLFLQRASGEELEDGLREYGNAIREIAAAGLFPGDLLLKNFGYTKHGRVIFYDYDEVMSIGECKFRKIPPPRYPEDELAGEPWYSIGPNDIFPEEFATFLVTDPEHKALFTRLHAGLFEANYWKQLQQTVANNEFPE
jgi:isocitrate dehydrogenase kinase/phosphatase